VIPNRKQFQGYIPGEIPKPVKLPRYIAHNNPWLQKMIELELYQITRTNNMKEGVGVNGTPTF
jgi:hypothetical protein